MVRAHGVDLLDLVAERHRLVDEELEKVVRRRLAREQLELPVHRARPRRDDPKRDLQASSERERARSAKAWLASNCPRGYAQ